MLYGWGPDIVDALLPEQLDWYLDDAKQERISINSEADWDRVLEIAREQRRQMCVDE